MTNSVKDDVIWVRVLRRLQKVLSFREGWVRHENGEETRRLQPISSGYRIFV